MILSPIPPEEIDAVLSRHAAACAPGGLGPVVLRRIADSRTAHEAAAGAWHQAAVDLTLRFGMAPLRISPQMGFSWDGRRVSAETEPAVLLHEVAHYQLASPARRLLPDFGLGAGPETGRAIEAERARCVPWEAREIEEQMASLLGILWELELGQPGIEAFQEQNWLEGAGQPRAARFLQDTLDRLAEAQLIDTAGRPRLVLRSTSD